MHPQYQPITSAEYDRITRLSRNLRLSETHPALALQLKSINPKSPTKLDLRVWQDTAARIDALARAYEDIPFLTAPPHLLPTGFPVAQQVGDGSLICLRTAGHNLMLGPTGAGKTTLVTWGARAARQGGVHDLVMDVKKDLAFLPNHDSDYLVLDANAPVNFLEVPPYLAPSDVKEAFTQSFLHSFYSAQLQRDVLEEALRYAFSTTTPCLLDLKHAVETLGAQRRTPQQRDSVQAVMSRLQRIIDHYPVAARTRQGVPLSTILNRSVYVPVNTYNDVYDWVFTYYLVNNAYLRNRALGLRDRLTHFVLIDESLFTVSTASAQAKIDKVNAMARLITVLREFSISVNVTATTLETTDKLILRNASAIFILPGFSETFELGRMFGFTDAQQHYIATKLTTGRTVVKLLRDWREPILAAFPPLPDHCKDVDFHSQQWRDTCARITTLNPHQSVHQPSIIRIDRQLPAPAPSTSVTTPAATAPAAPVNASTVPRQGARPARVYRRTARGKTVPVASGAQLVLHPTVALSEAETDLLRSAVDRIAPATAHYASLGLHPQTGQRAADKLKTLGLITTERIVVRAGRGGSAVAFLPTVHAYEHLGITPRHGTRGGDSVTHRYLVQELAAGIPGAAIEVNLAGKSADLIIRYEDAKHRRPLAYVTNHAQCLAPTNPFTEGILVAIEVEVSNPVATAPNNISLNRSAGISRTVVAVMPDQAEPLVRHLARALPIDMHECALVVDVYDWLDTLRSTTRAGGTV